MFKVVKNEVVYRCLLKVCGIYGFKIVIWKKELYRLEWFLIRIKL